MNLPCVVIAGRPNVGKSSLFNRILGRRAAVVSPREGVTRDRHYQNAEWNGKHFQLVDTGGFLPAAGDALIDQVRRHIETALDEAAVVLFVIDGQTGVTAADLEFARMVLRRRRPVLLVVNKAEKSQTALDAHTAWSLGMGEPQAVSARSGLGIRDLLHRVAVKLPALDFDPADPVLRLAVLGRPNSGKSTLVNALLGEERQITSAEAGTTRDSIDTEFAFQGRRIVITDTAGLRKKARVKDPVEYYSNLRALESIRRSQVCVLLVDAQEGVGEQDFRICQRVLEEGRGLILALSKWDAVHPDHRAFDVAVKAARHRNPDLEGVPFVAVSALTGQRVAKIPEMALQVKQNLERVLGRENVVAFFAAAAADHPHPGTPQGPVEVTRCCQVLVNPVGLAFETAHPERVLRSYARYLRRRAREYFELEGVPVRIWFRSRFQLRTDLELEEFLRGRRAGFEEWMQAEEAEAVSQEAEVA